jgi:hypothetical protein
MTFQRFFLFLAVLALCSSYPLQALEPLADQGDPMANELPMLPQSTDSAPAAQTDNTLPPLPGASDQASAPSDGALPPLPAGNTAPAGNAQTLPPLPGESSASNAGETALPPLPGQEGAAAPQGETLPPLPGQEAPAASASQEAMPPLPGQEPAAAPAAKAKTTTAKSQKPSRPWEATKKRVNAILGGWVRAKGGNESSRIAWASQGALHALVFHGYKVLDEKGLYEAQPGSQGSQWRLITFEAPKVKRTLEVYVTDVNGRVWMRVGPSEPPPFSVHSIGQVKAIRSDTVKALGHIRKQMGSRLRPHRGRSWEAPYSFAMASADHH